MKDAHKIRKGTKASIILMDLLAHGKISNVDVLNGKPVRTNRLAAIIHNLKTEYGVECEGKELRYPNGTYKDFIYYLTNKPELLSAESFAVSRLY